MENKKRKFAEIHADFREKLLEYIEDLYKTEKFYDVFLVAGQNQKRIPAHRLILSAASQYFAKMFIENATEKTEKEIILDHIPGGELKTLIDFCYTGTIDINERNVYRLLDTASKIQLTYIETKCNEFLISKMDVTNCLNIWTNVKQTSNLNYLALKYAAENFSGITETNEFLSLDADHLSTLLQNEYLNVYSEEEVFNVLSKWVNHMEYGRKRHVADLLNTIRFTQIRTEFLGNVVRIFCEKFGCLDAIRDVCMWKLMPQSQPYPMLPRTSTTTNRLMAVGNSTFKQVPVDGRCAEIYCYTSNKWSITNEINFERIGFCSVVLNNELFILGGMIGKTNKDTKVVEKYNFLSKELKNITPMMKERNWHAATVFNDNIYVAGGCYLKSVEKFDVKTESWSTVAPMLKKRRNFCLVALSGRLFAIGGRENENDLNSVERYDSLTKKWEFVTAMHKKRCSHAVAVYNDRLYVIGGVDKVNLVDSIEYYDPQIDKWTLVKTLSIPRCGFGFAASNNIVIIAGGLSNDNTQQSSVIKVNLEELTQQQIEPMKYARSHFNLIVMPRYNPNV